MGRYYSLNDYLQKKYGQKVYKLALDCGFTCPNRDETVGTEGCAFCADGGAGHFAKPTLAEAKAFLKNRQEEVDFRETQLSHMQYDSDTRGGLPMDIPAEKENSPVYDTVLDASDDKTSHDPKALAYTREESLQNGSFQNPSEDNQASMTLDTNSSGAASDTNAGGAAIDASSEGAALKYGSGWERRAKNVGDKFIAYYQTYSNTYAPAETLRQIFQPALEDEEIVGLAIATRPDCLPVEVLDLLAEINRIKPVWVELGLQTIHDKTADYFGRGYHLETFNEAVRKLRSRNLDVVVHLIMGLPGETLDDMLASVRYVNNCDIQGVKIHMLTVIRGTPLGDRYEEAIGRLDQSEGLVQLDTKLVFSDGTEYPFITLDKYADLICACIGLLRPEIVIHRITGDAPKDRLLSPMWTADKKRVLNLINLHLERRNITQGCLLEM